MIALHPHVLDIFDDDFNASSKNLSFESSNQCVDAGCDVEFSANNHSQTSNCVCHGLKNVVTFVTSRLATVAWINKDS